MENQKGDTQENTQHCEVLPDVQTSMLTSELASTAETTEQICPQRAAHPDGTGQSSSDHIQPNPPPQLSTQLPTTETTASESTPGRITSTREMLSQSAQQLVSDLNAKRKQDNQLMLDFRKSLDLHAQKAYDAVEQTMYQVYDRQSNMVQAKLKELFDTLDRIAKLEAELEEFKHALGLLYQDMSNPV